MTNAENAKSSAVKLCNALYELLAATRARYDKTMAKAEQRRQDAMRQFATNSEELMEAEMESDLDENEAELILFRYAEVYEQWQNAQRLSKALAA